MACLSVSVYQTKEEYGSSTSQISTTDTGRASLGRMKSKTRTSGSKQKFSVKERRLRRLGHSLHMDDSRLPKHTVYREVNSIEQKPGRWKIKIELDIWHYILGSEGNYSDLGRRATVFCQQRRLAIECSRMCLQTRELNYGLRTKIYWSEWTHTHTF